MAFPSTASLLLHQHTMTCSLIVFRNIVILYCLPHCPALHMCRGDPHPSGGGGGAPAPCVPPRNIVSFTIISREGWRGRNVRYFTSGLLLPHQSVTQLYPMSAFKHCHSRVLYSSTAASHGRYAVLKQKKWKGRDAMNRIIAGRV